MKRGACDVPSDPHDAAIFDRCQNTIIKPPYFPVTYLEI